MITNGQNSTSRDAFEPMEFAKFWLDCSAQPTVTPEIARHWDELIEDWLDSDLPIYVNKPEGNRGALYQHRSGRLIVPTDESPSIWAFELSLTFRCPTLQEIRQLQREDLIPVSQDFEPAERRRALFRCMHEENFSELRWNLCHSRQIGIDTQRALQMSTRDLEDHFRLFMAPSNMYVMPIR